jgi:hypothetical protein
MRKLSLWAKHHPVPARIIIGVSHVLLPAIAIFLAWQLFIRDIQLNIAWLFTFFILFITAAAAYPGKTKRNYFRQKSCDLAIAICGFGMVGVYSNQVFFNDAAGTPVIAAIPAHEPVYKNEASKKLLDEYYNHARTHFSKKEKRILKDEFGFQLKTYATALLNGDKQKADATATIILAIIGAGLLFYLVAALACNISCNGSDAAAVVVLVLGTAAIIFGLVAIIKAAKRKARKKNQEASTPEKNI